MKRWLFTFALVVSLLVSHTTSAFAAPLADGVVTLREARNDTFGNVIFVFNFTGDFSKSDFKGGVVSFGDQRFPLDCNIVEEGVVQCTTSRAVGGQNVVVNLAGFVFWTFVPERAAPVVTAPSEYCYDVYNSQTDESEEEFFWVPVDVHCQDTPATDGDTIEYDSWLYEFWSTISDGYCGTNGNNESGFFQSCSF